MTFWFWFFVGPAFALAFLSLRGEKKRARYVESHLTPAEPPLTPLSPHGSGGLLDL